MATLRIGFPLRLHMLSSAPSELPKEQAGAGDKKYKIVLSELHGLVASQVGSAKKAVALRHMPITLYFCFKTHVQVLAQTGNRHLSAAAPCLERINPLSRNLFCFLLMRVDAYPRLCSLLKRLLSMARFNYSLLSLVSLNSGSAILFFLKAFGQEMLFL